MPRSAIHVQYTRIAARWMSPVLEASRREATIVETVKAMPSPAVTSV